MGDLEQYESKLGKNPEERVFGRELYVGQIDKVVDMLGRFTGFRVGLGRFTSRTVRFIWGSGSGGRLTGTGCIS